MATKKKWADLSPGAKVALVVGSAIELVLTTVAARDLRSRARSEVRGPKFVWSLLLVVQPVGPIAYLLFGRRRR